MQRVYDKVNFTLSYIGTYVYSRYKSRNLAKYIDLPRTTGLLACMAHQNVWETSSSFAQQRITQTQRYTLVSRCAWQGNTELSRNGVLSRIVLLSMGWISRSLMNAPVMMEPLVWNYWETVWEGVQRYAKKLPNKAHRLTQFKAGVTKSCTVRLDNAIYCIHDGTWKDCPNGSGVNDLVIAVQKLYGSS